MPEKNLGWLTDAIVAVAAIAGAIWAKVSFISKRDHNKDIQRILDLIVDSDNRARFQYRQDCTLLQQACIRQNCTKFDELRAGQKEVWKTIDGIKAEMGKQGAAMERIDQKLTDLIQAVRNGRT